MWVFHQHPHHAQARAPHQLMESPQLHADQAELRHAQLDHHKVNNQHYLKAELLSTFMFCTVNIQN